MKMAMMKKMGTNMAGTKNLKRKRNNGGKGRKGRKQRPKKRAGRKGKKATLTEGLDLDREERPHNAHESQGSKSMSKTSTGEQSDDFKERIKDLLGIDDEAKNIAQAPGKNANPKEDPHSTQESENQPNESDKETGFTKTEPTESDQSWQDGQVAPTEATESNPIEGEGTLADDSTTVAEKAESDQGVESGVEDLLGAESGTTSTGIVTRPTEDESHVSNAAAQDPDSEGNDNESAKSDSNSTFGPDSGIDITSKNVEDGGEDGCLAVNENFLSSGNLTFDKEIDNILAAGDALCYSLNTLYTELCSPGFLKCLDASLTPIDEDQSEEGGTLRKLANRRRGRYRYTARTRCGRTCPINKRISGGQTSRHLAEMESLRILADDFSSDYTELCICSEPSKDVSNGQRALVGEERLPTPNEIVATFNARLDSMNLDIDVLTFTEEDPQEGCDGSDNSLCAEATMGDVEISSSSPSSMPSTMPSNEPSLIPSSTPTAFMSSLPSPFPSIRSDDPSKLSFLHLHRVSCCRAILLQLEATNR